MKKISTETTKELTIETLRETISQRLRQLISIPEIGTKKALAEKSQISRSTLSKVLNKKEMLSINNAILIAQNCGITLDYIYGLNDQPYLEQSVVELLEQHISAQTSKERVPLSGGDEVYNIPTITMSKSFKAYLDAIRNAEKLNDKDTQDAVRKAAKETLLKASGTEDKEEYVLIPRNKLNNAQLLEDIGFRPESQI